MKSIHIIVMVSFCLCVSACTHLPNDGWEWKWEVALGSKKPFIDETVDDVKFKFCLLDKNGIPANRFNEGDNFSFRLEMVNLGRDELERYIGLAAELRNDGFSEVISVEHGSIGFTVDQGVYPFVLQSYPFYGDDKQYQWTIPWIVSDEQESSLGFKSLHQPALRKGQYYTEFTHTFEFRIMPRTGVYIGPLTFKINFEVI